MKMNHEKLKYRQREVKYAGYIPTNQGHKPDPEKIEAISKMPRPEDTSAVRRFLGMANFLSKFMQRFSEISEPLRQLTCTAIPWQCHHEHGNAADKIKAAIVEAPVLAYFSNGEPIRVQNDASQHGLGAVLLQNSKPIAYASRAMTPTETNYAQIEREFLSVVFAMTKFDHYVYGRHVTIQSDHQPLQTILKKPIQQAPKRLQRRILQL